MQKLGHDLMWLMEININDESYDVMKLGRYFNTNGRDLLVINLNRRGIFAAAFCEGESGVDNGEKMMSV